jgi:hypothetical protein
VGHVATRELGPIYDEFSHVFMSRDDLVPVVAKEYV